MIEMCSPKTSSPFLSLRKLTPRAMALYLESLDRLQPCLQLAPYFGRLELVPGAGHWVQYEAPEAFQRGLAAILG